jgi:hypothetical protein
LANRVEAVADDLRHEFQKLKETTTGGTRLRLEGVPPGGIATAAELAAAAGGRGLPGRLHPGPAHLAMVGAIPRWSAAATDPTRGRLCGALARPSPVGWNVSAAAG